MESAPAPPAPPARLAPVVFFSSVLTHLFGGSAGCEGASLLIGGGVGSQIARRFRLHHEEYRMLVLCAMASAFSPLLGTPLAAAFFVLERSSKSQLSFFVPCLLASYGAYTFALELGVTPLRFAVQTVPLEFSTLASVGSLALICAGVGVFFQMSLDGAARFCDGHFASPYRAIFVGALLVVGLLWGLGTMRYCGTGLAEIHQALSGFAAPQDFFWKLVLTALTLGIGFKGGRIVPAFFIGATLGAVAGGYFGLDAGFAASLGLIVVFSSVVRCPITAVILSQEIFFHANPVYFLVAVLVGEVLFFSRRSR